MTSLWRRHFAGMRFLCAAETVFVWVLITSTQHEGTWQIIALSLMMVRNFVSVHMLCKLKQCVAKVRMSEQKQTLSVYFAPPLVLLFCLFVCESKSLGFLHSLFMSTILTMQPGWKKLVMITLFDIWFLLNMVTVNVSYEMKVALPYLTLLF